MEISLLKYKSLSLMSLKELITIWNTELHTLVKRPVQGERGGGLRLAFDGKAAFI
jgi:hypothetical protein